MRVKTTTRHIDPTGIIRHEGEAYELETKVEIHLRERLVVLDDSKPEQKKPAKAPATKNRQMRCDNVPNTSGGKLAE